MRILLASLGLLAALRLAELVYSLSNWRHHRGHARLQKERHFLTMVLLHVGFFVVQPIEFHLRRPDYGDGLSLLALIVVLIAFALRFWTLANIGRSWNVRIVHGRDYPIVTSGPYRYIRHPNYLVVFLEVLFFPLIFHLYYAALLLTLGNLFVLSRRIPAEEAVLMQNPDWNRSMAGKPRFLPRLFGKPGQA